MTTTAFYALSPEIPGFGVEPPPPTKPNQTNQDLVEKIYDTTIQFRDLNIKIVSFVRRVGLKGIYDMRAFYLLILQLLAPLAYN